MRPKSIYVAGSSKERELVSAYMRGLEAAGWRITLDWPAAMDASPVADTAMTLVEQERHAYADLKAIDDADVFWLITPSTPSTGAWFEAGYARRADRRPRIVISGAAQFCLFSSLAHERYDDHASAFAALTRDWAAHAEVVERLAAR